VLGVGRGGFLPRCNRRSFHFVSSCPRSSSRSLHDPSSFRLKRLPCSRPGRGLMPLVVHWSGRDGLWVSPGPHSRLKPPPISRSQTAGQAASTEDPRRVVSSHFPASGSLRTRRSQRSDERERNHSLKSERLLPGWLLQQSRHPAHHPRASQGTAPAEHRCR